MNAKHAKKMVILAPAAAVLLLSAQAWAQSDTEQSPPTRSSMHKKSGKMHHGAGTSQEGAASGAAAGTETGGPGTSMGKGMGKGAQSPTGDESMGPGGATGGATSSGGKAGY